MNKNILAFELGEAQIHLSELIKSLDTFSDEDEVTLAIEIGHILSHFNLAWHFGTERIADNEYADRLSSASDLIPNFTGEFRLLEHWDIRENSV